MIENIWFTLSVILNLVLLLMYIFVTAFWKECGRRWKRDEVKAATEQNRLRDELEKVWVERDKLRKLLNYALPHIECTNSEQSSLITVIGEYLQALKGE